MKKIGIVLIVLMLVAVSTAAAIHMSTARVTYRENATKTNLKGTYYRCADRNWGTGHALPTWTPPYIVGYSNYTIPWNANVVTWICKDAVGLFHCVIPQSSITGSSWVNITMFYDGGDPYGDGYMYVYRTANTGMTAMPGAAGYPDRWSPTNMFYEEGLSYFTIS